MKGFTSWLTLFASTGTLLCCALPSLLVVLGMGATMAGLVSAVPQIVWISKYKAWVFIGSGVMICLAAFLNYKSRNDPCPLDPDKAKACATSRKWSIRILILSGILWTIGATVAFLLPIFV